MNKYDGLIEKIFERAEKPIEEIQRIQEIVPSIFLDEKVLYTLDKNVKKYGYKVNSEYISSMNMYNLLSHPSCGSNGYGNGGHPSCGSNGYGSGGHPSCCASVNKGKTKLLIKRENLGNGNGINY